MLRYGLAPVFVLVLALAPQSAQPPRGKTGTSRPTKGKAAANGEKHVPTTHELLRWLEEPLEMKDFQGGITLKEVFERFSKAFAAKGKDLPLLVDVEAFREENPDAPDIDETLVKFPRFPRRRPFREALTLALRAIPTNNATFILRRGVIEITTFERASPELLLKLPIRATFDKRPLVEALYELSDMTGATIIVDPRVGEQARKPITAAFKNPIPMEAATKLLVEMAGLHVREFDDNLLFITVAPKHRAAPWHSELRIRNRPLALALRDVADWSGTSIVQDPQAKTPREFALLMLPFDCPIGPLPPNVPSGNIRVSVTFKAKTSGIAAAKILAVLVGLEGVSIDNAVFVTTRRVAERMRGNPAKEQPTKKPVPK